MRDLSGTDLEAAQKLPTVKALYKIVLTFSGEATQTYTSAKGGRILDISHTEEPYRQTAEVLLDNTDGTLTDIDFKGYKGVISYGATTSGGDEYSATAPLWVVGQQLVSWGAARSGRLACSLALAGTPNLLGTQGASAIYAPDSTDTDTVKTILTAIARKTLAPYTDYHDFAITFTDEDTLIDSFQPKDGFSIYLNESRLSAIKRLVRLTKCVMRVEDDEEIHIFEPTTTGATYDYEYELGAGNHPFFSMSNRKRLVIPYYVQVDSHPSHGDDFTGNATDTATATLVASDDTLDQREYKYLRLEDNTQAGNIAAAILSHYQLDAEKGSATVPMNVGAEVYDYVECIDSRDSDTTRIGNIGYIHRHCAPGVFTMDFRFGSVSAGGLAGTIAPYVSEGETTGDPTTGGALTLSQILPILNYLMELINRILAYLEQFEPGLGKYLYMDADGDLILNPKSGRHTFGNRIFTDTRFKIPVGSDMFD